MKNQEFINNNHHYKQLEENMQKEFHQLLCENQPLFKVSLTDDLWLHYLELLELSSRQQYNCSCCKAFIRKYGDLVILTEDGQIKSALWHPETVPDYFKAAVTQLKKVVEASSIKTVFYSDQRQLGTPFSGERSHLSLMLPKHYVSKSALKTANQLMAEKKAEFQLFEATLHMYSRDSVSTMKTLIDSGALYRSERFIGMISWFAGAQQVILKEKDALVRERLMWRYIAKAKTGYCHLKNSMIGTLLDDYQEGINTDELIRRYNDKMDPSQYMRAQSAPTEGALIEAEKLVEKLGITDALDRRFARLDEIPEFIWRSPEKKVEKQKMGLFSGIIPKIPKVKIVDWPITTMTWKKFSETFLPQVNKIEARVDDTNRLMSLVTENIPDSKSIFQWDNPFSWYYHGGVDGEIKRRVQEAGGRYEENDIRCSLIWENRTDLDLHCLTPAGKHIFYNRKRETNGWLDVDMNVRGETMYPVENIRWTKGEGVEGNYRFYVHNYRDRSNGWGTPFKVELEVAGQVYTYQGELSVTDAQETVFEFIYKKGKLAKMLTSNQSREYDTWNLTQGTFVEVTGITKSPNLWGERNWKQSGNHIFFLLKGCRDESQGKGRGFFNEMLIPELREIRKTLEIYSAMTPIKATEMATACGLGFSKEAEWNVLLKISIDGMERLIKIDRFD